jgi:hypothetical protein
LLSQQWLTLLGCLCLIPNPALPVGNLRLQMVNFVLLLYIIFRARTAQRRAFNAWLLLSIPAMTCAVVYLSIQLYAIETLKLCALWMLGTAHMVPGTPRDGSDTQHLLKGVSIGILVNFGVCVLQLLTVPSDSYPFWSWYGYGASEASMIRGLQSGAGIFGVRVFGLFLEPSDMTASIGHWWLLMCGLRLGVGGAALERFSSSRLCTAALFGGAPLLMLSRSGHALVIAAGFAVLLTAAMGIRKESGNRGRIILVLALVAALSVGVYDLKDRIVSADAEQAGYTAGSVWAARASSIVESLSLWKSGSAREFIFGLGYEGTERIKSDTGYNIWSVIGKSILTFGLVALLGWLALAAVLLREVTLSRAPLLGLVFGGTCAVAVAVTTSYEPLVSPWLAFGVLLSWRRVFGVRTAYATLARPAVSIRPILATNSFVQRGSGVTRSGDLRTAAASLDALE